MFKLPKNYVSHSQISLWRAAKTHRQYIKRYFFKEPQFQPKEFAFGKDVAEELEKENIFDVKPEYLNILMQLPRIGTPEVELVKQMRGYYTKSFLDRYDYETNTIIEFKTGKNAWNQRLVDEAEQLKFYSWSVERNFGEIPNCQLWYMETENDPKADFKIKFTGKVEKFETKFNEFDLELFELNLETTVREIATAYDQYLNGEDLSLIYNWR